MSTYNLVSDGTLTLFDRVFNDFADDDISAVTFPNDLVTMKTGKNGNTIYVKNEQGRNANAIIRLIRGSNDDRLLQSKIAAMKADFGSTELAFGEFVIRVADGEGGVVRDVYTLKGGVITKPVEGKENVSGDTEQGVAVYNIMFADSERSAQ
tara:strand:+ start:2915 stop:3370 length:456 start_codon:yes stop_codon:yes gene_type:complete